MTKQILVLLALVLISLPARAQILWVTGDYKVVCLDTERHRIGISLASEPTNTRQNWCYLNLDSQMLVKVYDEDGWAKEIAVPSYQILERLKAGDYIRINGGRAMDLSITAKKIWFDTKQNS